MPEYRCKIANPDGSVVIKSLNSDSKVALKKLLERQGNFVLEIRRDQGIANLFKIGTRGRSLKTVDFISFNQEFTVLLKTGLPIVQAMDAIIEKSEKGPFVGVLKMIRKDVATGESLSGAFAKYPHMFTNLYIASIQAGEKSGDLPSSITRYNDYLKKMATIRKKVISASIYPIILTVVSVFVLALLLVYVVPAFTRTFFETNTELPAMTTFLINTSNLLRSNFLITSIFSALFVLGFIYFRNTEAGRLTLDRWRLNLPFISDLFLSYATARLTRSLATVLSGGTPLLESLRISSGAIGNMFLQLKIEDVINKLEEGGGFSESLQKTKAFPKLAIRMIAAGESGGALEQVLNEISDFYDAQIDAKLSLLTSIIEPALMVIMGLLIGFVVLAMYLPIFQLAGTVG